LKLLARGAKAKRDRKNGVAARRDTVERKEGEKRQKPSITSPHPEGKKRKKGAASTSTSPNT